MPRVKTSDGVAQLDGMSQQGVSKRVIRVTHLQRGVVGQLLGDGADVGVVELGGKLQGLGRGGGNEEWGRKGKGGRGEVCVGGRGVGGREWGGRGVAEVGGGEMMVMHGMGTRREEAGEGACGGAGWVESHWLQVRGGGGHAGA